MVIGKKEHMYDVGIALILFLIGAVVLIPIMYVVSVSLSPLSAVLKYGFTLVPREISLEAYARVFSDSLIPSAFQITLLSTCIGVVLSVILTLMFAYALSQKDLPGRKVFIVIVIFTMLFSGGLIPTYILVKNLQLTNTIWALILPDLIWTFCVIILRSFIEQLPQELLESARVDGVGEWSILLYIICPLSVPALMTVGMYYMVGYWNQYFAGILYITKTEMYPLQVAVRLILAQSQDMYNNPDIVLPTKAMQMAVVVSAALPVVAIYPFIQKHFTKGVLLGAVKG